MRLKTDFVGEGHVMFYSNPLNFVLATSERDDIFFSFSFIIYEHLSSVPFQDEH